MRAWTCVDMNEVDPSSMKVRSLILGGLGFKSSSKQSKFVILVLGHFFGYIFLSQPKFFSIIMITIHVYDKNYGHILVWLTLRCTIMCPQYTPSCTKIVWNMFCINPSTFSKFYINFDFRQWHLARKLLEEPSWILLFGNKGTNLLLDSNCQGRRAWSGSHFLGSLSNAHYFLFTWNIMTYDVTWCVLEYTVHPHYYLWCF